MWVKALPKGTVSTANSAQLVIEPVISCLQVAHPTTEPQHPTQGLTVLSQVHGGFDTT